MWPDWRYNFSTFKTPDTSFVVPKYTLIWAKQPVGAQDLKKIESQFAQINNVNDFKMALIQNAQKESNNYIFKNTTLYFSQTFNFSDLSMNSTITFDNSALFINGGLSLSDKNQIIQFSNNCIVASNGDMQLKNQKNLNGAYISFSNITFDNSTLNSGSLYAQENIFFGQQLGATDCTINLVPQTSNNIFYKQISSNSGVTVTTNNWCFDI